MVYSRLKERLEALVDHRQPGEIILRARLEYQLLNAFGGSLEKRCLHSEARGMYENRLLKIRVQVREECFALLAIFGYASSVTVLVRHLWHQLE